MSIKKYKKAGAVVIVATVVAIIVVGIVFFVNSDIGGDSVELTEAEVNKPTENIKEVSENEYNQKEDNFDQKEHNADEKEHNADEDIQFGENVTMTEILKALGANQPLYISFFNEMADGHVITNEPRYVSFDKITKAMNDWPALQQIVDIKGGDQKSLLGQCTDGMNNNFGIDVYGDNKRTNIIYKLRMVNEKLGVYTVNGSV